MRAAGRRALAALLLAAVATLAGGGYWLLGTAAGARWLLANAARRLAVRIEVGEVSGRLAGELRLRSVDARWPGGEATADAVRLRWRPLPLLRGTVSVAGLSVAGLAVTLPETTQAAPLEFSWPTVAGLPSKIEARIDALRLSGVSIRRGRGRPVALDELAAGAEWKDGVATLSGLTVKTRAATVTGTAAAGFSKPSLRAELSARLGEAGRGPQTVSLSSRLEPAGAPFTLAGPTEVAATWPGPRTVRVAGDLRLGRREAALGRLALSLPGQPEAASGSARLRLGGGEPRAEAALELHGLDLSEIAAVRTSLSGTLHAAGTPEGYAGSVSLANRGEGVRAVRASGPFSGDLDGIAFPRLAARWLGGEVTGDLSVRWSEGFRVKGAFAGKGLDPARIAPQWPGRINFTVRGHVERSARAGLTARADGRLLSSTLRHKALSGSFRFGLDGGGLSLARLDLHGDGFDVTASGRPAERLALSADVRSLGGLLPGAAGSAKARGWARWRNGSVSGTLAANGEELSVAGARVDSFSLTASRENPRLPFSVRAEARGVAKDGIRADFVSLEAAGTPPDHTARAAVRSAAGEAEAAVRGGYRGGRWNGTVETFSVREKEAGRWLLATPVALAASSGGVTVGPFRLDGPGGATVSGAADLALRPLRGSLRADWTRLDPALANPWLRGLRLSGTSSGSAAFRRTDAGQLAIALRAEASGTFRAGAGEFAVRSAHAELDWDARGLASRWNADLAGKGTVRGRVSSDEPARAALPSRGEGRAEWHGVDLALLSPWLPGTGIAGVADGAIDARWRENRRVDVSGAADLSATLVRGTLTLSVPRAHVALEGGDRGLRASVDLALQHGGTLTGHFSSGAPARIALPDRGTIRLECDSVDLAIVSPWLPEGLQATGALSGRADGEWFPGGKVTLDGGARLASGALGWTARGGNVNAAIRSADVRFHWAGETASGEISATLAEYGTAQAKFRIPLPARIPPSVRADGPVEASLAATVREKGLASALFPGSVQESSGEVGVSIRVGGRWSSPRLEGTALLSHAGAYLPAAGIEIKDVALKADLAGQDVKIASFSARSGSGSLEGSGVLHLEGWRIGRYTAVVKGTDFRTVDLPEFQLTTSPDLSVEGTPRRVKIRGEVAVPDLLVRGRQTQPPVSPSPDVVIVDEKIRPEEGGPIALDVLVKVVLGKHVLVKAHGIDARLDGSLTLETDEKNRFLGRGRIHVAQGSYSVYGIRLNIERGNLFFAGTPVERPSLDVLALRTVGETKAGVEVAGTLRQPVVKLYSRPPMEDTDVLSYIVLGHPLGQQASQAQPLMLAAGALLPAAQSAVLQDRLKRHFGLDVLTVTTSGSATGATTEGAGATVATPAMPGGAATAAGSAAGSTPGGVAGTAVTVGKYLNPRLYVSYGRSIFTGSNQVTARYEFRKRWQLESKVGQESGIDLYYKIEFR